MYMIAKLYDSEAQANAAISELVEIGIPSDSIALLSNPKAAAADETDGEGNAVAAEAAADPAAMATAVKAGRMLGSRADYYLSRLEPGRCLLVATPHLVLTGVTEAIMDAHNPLPYSHEPPRKEFVPVSEQATPFSDWLGLPVLTKSATPFSDLCGFSTKQEGLSHFSRWLAPLATDFTLSSKVGLGLTTKSDTPLSSKLGMSTKSNRLEGKNSSFGMGVKADLATPFSSLLGLPLLSKRQQFLTGENEPIS